MVDDGPRIQHQLVTHAEPQFIDQQDQLLEMLQHLRSTGRFAYDSEFIGELTYIPKLCLIQVASAQRIGLIDPLGNLDLTPFWDLLCDPTVEKIVHAGQQDVEPVFRNCGKSVANLFDTQICAGFIGLAYPTSLSKLVLELIGAKLGKGLTFTHWDQRPLSAMQLKYAADDVRYLIAVHDSLNQKLQSQNHAQWARIECESLCDPTQYGFNPNTNFLRIRGGNSLPPRQQSVLKELTIWRDTCAAPQHPAQNISCATKFSSIWPEPRSKIWKNSARPRPAKTGRTGPRLRNPRRHRKGPGHFSRTMAHTQRCRPDTPAVLPR